MTGSCEYGNEQSISVKFERLKDSVTEILTTWRTSETDAHDNLFTRWSQKVTTQVPPAHASCTMKFSQSRPRSGGFQKLLNKIDFDEVKLTKFLNDDLI